MDRRPLLRRRNRFGVLGAVVLALLAGCAAVPGQIWPSAEDPLTIYSGRSEELVAPLLARLEAAVGGDVTVRYGSTDELAAQLLQEGPGSPADVFFGQDAGALGSLGAAGLLAPLPADVVAPVAARYRAA